MSNWLHNMYGRPRDFTAAWYHLPLSGQAVTVQLSPGIHAALGRWLGLPTSSDVDALIAHADTLLPQMQSTWAALDWHGVILLNVTDDETVQALCQARAHRPAATITPLDDPWVTLNILARARDEMLLPGLPPHLETPFLERHLLSDDPRLLALLEAEVTHADES
ncbi:MAG: hypothetical protein ACLFTK_17230 [Anaerolineales bacterium]